MQSNESLRLSPFLSIKIRTSTVSFSPHDVIISPLLPQEKFLAVLGDYDSIGMDHAGSIKVDCLLFPFF
jgi:hypothetical protein